MGKWYTFSRNLLMVTDLLFFNTVFMSLWDKWWSKELIKIFTFNLWTFLEGNCVRIVSPHTWLGVWKEQICSTREQIHSF